MIKTLVIPMPPTSNRVTMPMHGRLVKSTEYRIYESKMQYYKLKNGVSLDEIYGYFKDKLLRVDTVFVFNHNRVFTKKGALKILDASNRIKITHDIVSKLIGIDDSRFVEGFFSKTYCENNREEYVVITIYEVSEIKGYKI